MVMVIMVVKASCAQDVYFKFASYFSFNPGRPGEGVYGEQYPSWDEVEQAL